MRRKRKLTGRCLQLAILCIACVSVPQTTLGQGVLGEMRSQVRAPPATDSGSSSKRKKSKRKKKSSSRGNSYFDEDEDDESLLSIFFEPLVDTVLSGWFQPKRRSVPAENAAHLPDPTRGPAFYLDYPYQDNEWGSLVIQPYGARRSELRTWSARVRGEYLDDFADFSVIGGQLLLEHTTRLGLDAESHYRRETLGTGRHDSLWTGDANMFVRLAQSPRFQLRAGGGMNWLSDVSQTDFGLNATLAADWFIGDPFISSTELDVGTLGSADLFHFRSTLGIQRHHVEVYTGYDHFRVGGVTIGGLVSGVRLWW